MKAAFARDTKMQDLFFDDVEKDQNKADDQAPDTEPAPPPAIA